MYVDEGYNPQDDGGNLTFSVQINVYGKDGLSMEDRMMKAYVSGEDFHSNEYIEKITSIVTKGDTVIPEGVIESWDISEKQNGSVIAYIEDDGTGAGTYKVTIGAQDKIIANYDMSMYFLLFTSCTTMDLSYLDTSLTTDMASLFYGCYGLTELDLSNFNTSNVTSMAMMFSGGMFDGTPMNLTKITFGDDFDTSNVTNMSFMFFNCFSLKELDLSNFNTSSVTTMQSMFAGCHSLTNLDLGNFNTSNVINMMQMFENCYALTELDLRNFDTTSVTYYSDMFRNVKPSSLSSILVTRDTWTIPNTVITNAIATDFTYV